MEPNVHRETPEPVVGLVNQMPAAPTPVRLSPVTSSASREGTLESICDQHTVKEVDQQIEQKGFPELNLLWSEYRKNEPSVGTPTIAELQSMLSKHTAPLFGYPRSISLGIGLGASLASIGYTTWILPVNVANSAITPWIAANLFIIGLITTSAVQRYFTSPLMKTMSSAVGTMLRSRSFVCELKNTGRFERFNSRAKNLGITSEWDNKDYKCSYELRDGEVIRHTPQSLDQLIHQTVQTFLGRKDDDRRKFIPGRFLDHLKDGKKSVSRFVSKNSEVLGKSKRGELSTTDGIALLKDLLSEVVETCEGALYLSTIISKIESGNVASRNVFEVQVWQRDPWKDLTHQEEFYSSASLRGVKKMGRDSKGRMGTFEYLMNPAISCLDFTLGGERIVRVRCGLSLLKDSSGGKYPVLFVDGVEGSNQVPNKVILRGIQEFAQAANVKGIFINAHAHNEVPKRFIRSVRKAGFIPGAAHIELLDTESRQYLDAFGTPIQPFEYAPPVGRVVGFFIPSAKGDTISLQKPTVIDQTKNFLRMHSYWIMFGQALVGAPLVTAQTSPLTSALLVTAGLAAGSIQLAFQRRSLKTLRD